MREQIDRAEVANRDFRFTCVERDLGAQIGAVNRADMLLRRAHVACILERDPRMAGFEQHRQHLPPELHRGKPLEELQFPPGDAVLVTPIRFLERLSPFVVEIRHVGR